MELNENSLDNVAGGTGKVIKDENGEFFVLPPHAKSFSTLEAANTFAENFGHGPRGRHCCGGKKEPTL
ncbi:MAG: hypothetical protein LBR79_06510 [Oscillospiraceae bacterium]|nr:hypothetical protein [Oscillospiraceae bacterium]